MYFQEFLTEKSMKGKKRRRRLKAGNWRETRTWKTWEAKEDLRFSDRKVLEIDQDNPLIVELKPPALTERKLRMRNLYKSLHFRGLTTGKR